MINETTLRVRYAETDAMGVAHHASYVVWLEVGRTELLRQSGTSYRAIEATGLLVVLSDLHLRYHAAARYDDTIVITTTLLNVRSRGLRFGYQLRLSDGTQLVTATTEHIIVARATLRPTRLPPDVLATLNAVQQ